MTQTWTEKCYTVPTSEPSHLGTGPWTLPKTQKTAYGVVKSCSSADRTPDIIHQQAQLLFSSTPILRPQASTAPPCSRITISRFTRNCSLAKLRSAIKSTWSVMVKMQGIFLQRPPAEPQGRNGPPPSHNHSNSAISHWHRQACNRESTLATHQSTSSWAEQADTRGPTRCLPHAAPT
jgi:hypothetical protein